MNIKPDWRSRFKQATFDMGFSPMNVYNSLMRLGFGKLKREGIIDIYSAHTVEIMDMEKIEELALAD